MIEWHTQQTAHYERDLSYYEKKHLNELVAVSNNLDTYFETLKECGNPLQVTAQDLYIKNLTG